jgi:hypothetical protein
MKTNPEHSGDSEWKEHFSYGGIGHREEKDSYGISTEGADQGER